MKIYIRSAAAISAQRTFGDVPFLTEPVDYQGTRLTAIEPDYKEFVDPKLARRMSRIIKMGVAAALQCLKEAQVTMPGAIITGTALGCQEDTISFLTRIIELDEEMLPPTAFIQSTHNTVAAQIALTLKCHQYNNTFVHKGISFESALLDATMLLNEGDADNILVGGTEEMTDTAFKILTRLGLYKRWPLSNLDLLKTKSKGTIGSEGSVFFLLTEKSAADNLAELVAACTFYRPKNISDIELNINKLLDVNSIKMEDIDLVITGKNGDLKNDGIYEILGNSIFANSSLANYKHLSGEYPTSVSFALWLAVNIIKRGEVPVIVAENNLKNKSPKKILIYNHYQNTYHSLMLVSAC
ncbi:beta-ketoacyl synthase chain length factor [Mucilaginibacter sp. UR6-11]|uniref:beta-ketoacyl synthase chain length factor n=1 Tax=Mucilaginibacter sp. UR6-11 TaxID=1435644 RepID=UPI001E2CD54D|nr:beta-ketoacyl synthase chain length factor [Mucilaginibacter sp. UR6-11]MCC8425871.1 beta-ketoacyl synthase chain length factor [Mucilaginibacter sp. UR6-11]